MVLIGEVLGSALRGKTVTVTLKSGLALTGTLRQMDEQHMNLCLDHVSAQVRRVIRDDDTGAISVVHEDAPPHMACVKTVQVRGSALRSIDFDPSSVSLDLMARAIAME